MMGKCETCGKYRSLNQAGDCHECEVKSFENICRFCYSPLDPETGQCSNGNCDAVDA